MSQEVMNELVNMSQEIIKLKDQKRELLEALECARKVVLHAGACKLSDGTYFDKDCSATLALGKINAAISKAEREKA